MYRESVNPLFRVNYIVLVVPPQTLHIVLYTGLYNGVYAVGHYQYSLKVTINLLNSYLRESYEVMVIVPSYLLLKNHLETS